MRLALALVLAILSVGARGQSPAPEVLVAQVLLPSSSASDPNVLVADSLADELAEQGRVRPILWSMSDPVFRAYVESGILGEFKPRPSVDQIREAGRKLRVDFVLLVVGQRTEGKLYPVVELYAQGQTAADWKFGPETDKDALTLTVQVNGLTDWDSSARTVARTVAAKLGDGPFHKYVARPRVAPTTPTNPTTTTDSGAAGPLASGTDSLARADALMRAGQWESGILLLRDAIDLDPTDLSSRQALVEALFAHGLYAQSALEARRAAPLVENGEALRLQAARSWLADSQFEEAKVDVNEAQMRGATGPEVWSLLAEIDLLEGDSERAIERFAKVLEVSPTSEARLGLACAYALAGRAEDSEREFAQLRQADGAELERMYERTIQLVDRALMKVVDDLRLAPQLIRMNPRAPEVVARAATIEVRVRALGSLTGAIPVPQKYQRSHAARDLAHKLLAQCAQEVLAFAKSGDPDIGTEAAISLAEAVKLLPSVRESYAAERTGLARAP